MLLPSWFTPNWIKRSTEIIPLNLFHYLHLLEELKVQKWSRKIQMKSTGDSDRGRAGKMSMSTILMISNVLMIMRMYFICFTTRMTMTKMVLWYNNNKKVAVTVNTEQRKYMCSIFIWTMRKKIELNAKKTPTAHMQSPIHWSAIANEFSCLKHFMESWRSFIHIWQKAMFNTRFFHDKYTMLAVDSVKMTSKSIAASVCRLPNENRFLFFLWSLNIQYLRKVLSSMYAWYSQ